MPMVVKIVGSTPTTPTINESEVVGVLDTEQNKQIYEAGRRKQTDLRAKRTGHTAKVTAAIAKVSYLLACLILDLVVQLVRISACHAEGREFESRLDRSYKLNTIIDG